MNAPLFHAHFQATLLDGCNSKPTQNNLTGNGQLTRGAITINDFLRNSRFSPESSKNLHKFFFYRVANVLICPSLIIGDDTIVLILPLYMHIGNFYKVGLGCLPNSYMFSCLEHFKAVLTTKSNVQKMLR